MARRQGLDAIGALATADIASLVAGRSHGQVKLFVTQRGLALRRQQPEVFARGDYVPLEIIGPLRDHIVGFARALGEQAVIAVVPRLLAKLMPPDESPFTAEIWQRTSLSTANLPFRWRDAFTNEPIETESPSGFPELPLGRLFRNLPLALLSSI